MRTIRQILPSRLKTLGNGLMISSPLPAYGVRQVGPFLLLDHVGPQTIYPEQNHDLAPHPHRGFEPVSLLFEGSIEHRDSAGHHGVLHAHDVQWMTAGSGIVPAEGLGKEASANGARFHAIQLWVNLPAKYKMTQPRYQHLASKQIPEITGVGFRCG